MRYDTSNKQVLYEDEDTTSMIYLYVEETRPLIQLLQSEIARAEDHLLMDNGLSRKERKELKVEIIKHDKLIMGLIYLRRLLGYNIGLEIDDDSTDDGAEY
jgi:hypothetical protein